MKKVGLCIVILLIAVILAIVLPWDKVGVLRKNILGEGDQFGSLKVYSLGGDLKVFIDGEERGTVLEEESYVEIVPIPAGEHEVMLQREESGDSFYPEFVRTIWFEQGVDAVISWEIGPSTQSSSGWMVYSKKSGRESDQVRVHVQCEPEDCDVLLDNSESVDMETREVNLDTNIQHTFKVSADGYQDLEFLLLPEDNDSRDLLKGSDLYLEINLYQIPII